MVLINNGQFLAVLIVFWFFLFGCVQPNNTTATQDADLKASAEALKVEVNDLSLKIQKLEERLTKLDNDVVQSNFYLSRAVQNVFSEQWEDCRIRLQNEVYPKTFSGDLIINNHIEECNVKVYGAKGGLSEVWEKCPAGMFFYDFSKCNP